MEEKKNNLFRQKSLDKISSPDELDKYIKTTSPTVVILFASVVVLLVGLIVWAVVGKIEVKSSVGFYIDSQGITTSYITEADYESHLKNKTDEYICSKMSCYVNNIKVDIKYVDHQPKVCDFATATQDQKILFNYSGITGNSNYYEIYAYAENLEEGPYKGKIVFSVESPIGYIF